MQNDKSRCGVVSIWHFMLLVEYLKFHFNTTKTQINTQSTPSICYYHIFSDTLNQTSSDKIKVFCIFLQ